ncbi:MAG TPA: hypothetical protein VGM41_15555 [Chitinophagaceae bacterium]
MTNQPPADPGFSTDDFVKGYLPAFGNVYTFYYPGVIRMARELLQDNNVVETIVTDSFLKLWIKHADLNTPQNIEAFLHNSVQRGCFSYLKQVENLTNDQLRRMQEAMARANPPREKKTSETMQAIILGWFNQLPSATSLVARLSWDETIPDEQIAKRLDIPVFHVKEQKMNGMLLIMEHWFSKTEKELAAFRKLLESVKE